MLKIVPYSKELLASFIYNGVECEITGGQIIPMVEFYNRLGECCVGLVDDKVIGIGGIYKLWENSGGCFLFLNREAQNHKKDIFKVLVQHMNTLLKKYEIKTLIVECLDDSLEANRLLAHLGFKRQKEIKMAFYIR